MSDTREWLVAGRVQGVAFRANARREALSLGLDGLAENLPDGRVRVIGIGSPEALERFERWLAEGPRHARVDSVTPVPAGEASHPGNEGREESEGFVIR